MDPLISFDEFHSIRLDSINQSIMGILRLDKSSSGILYNVKEVDI